MMPARYMTPLDEAELFAFGATSWRMDVGTWRSFRAALDRATWSAAPDTPRDFPGHIADKPIGDLDAETEVELTHALALMINDPSLVPGIAQMGVFRIGGIELQNGALDDNWHHDGLAGRRHGHAGDFFLICYGGEAPWEAAWGGHFEYGARRLEAGWPVSGFRPDGEVRRIAPAGRTALLGWNQNPCLVHRAAPLTAAKDRPTLIASLDLVPR